MSVEPFHARVELGDADNEDHYRDVSIYRPAGDEARPTVAVYVSSIGLAFSLYLSPAKALEIGRAIVAASGLGGPPGGHNCADPVQTPGQEGQS